MEPIPGGFPSAERQTNAVQIRVSQSGLTQITNNPAALLSGIGSGPAPGVVEFGGIQIDLNRATNDAPRLVITPNGATRLDVTMRARLKTPTPMDVDVPVFGTCKLTIDTTGALTPDTGDDCGPIPNPPNPGDGNHCDVKIDVPITFTQEPNPIKTTRVNIGTVAISQLTADDIQLGGNFQCDLADAAVSALDFVFDLLLDQMTGTIQDQIEGQVCKKCPTGGVDECGPFASACTDNVCMKDQDNCLQELGIAGRLRGSSLFASLSPGTTGAIDLYEVAGGYATTNNQGISLGMLGGMVPGGSMRDRCGPMATAPANATIDVSPFFQDNLRPDNNAPFDVAFGVHKSQLADFAYAGYDGGLLCLTITGTTISQLSTDTISLLARSLSRLNEGNAPMAVGLRPQSPPTITLGRNTFMDDGNGGSTLVEALLDIKFTGMEIDFFASVDDQYVRVLTLVTDIHFPIGLQVTAMGELSPVIATPPEGAFSNLTVKNSEALTESPEDIAELFPTILELVLPQLSGGLGSIALPELGGLKLDVTDVTGIPTNVNGPDIDFLAIFANLELATFQKPVHTTAEVGEVYDPPAEDARHPRNWKRAKQPSVQLHLGGDAQELQYSYKIDQGTWTPWSTNANPVITSRVFWLPGSHNIEVRARRKGHPETVDLTPVALSVPFGLDSGVPGAIRFHGQSGGGGCDCDASNNPTGALPFLALVLGLLIPFRRVRKLQRLGGFIRASLVRTPLVVLVAAIACLPACSCADYCGDEDCISGDLEHGGLGRWTSIAADERRVLVATHDQGLGDLVVADVTNPDDLALVAVDGIPEGVTPTHEEGSYRRGIEGEGPNVGAWTSIAISGGLGRASYQDRDAKALKFALEPKAGTLTWNTMVVDAPSGDEEFGRYTSLVFDANAKPAIAYLALGIDDGAGHRNTELRLARSGSPTPAATNDWVINTIATGVGTCGGLCAAGEACVVGEMGQTCTAVTTDCTGDCADGEACVAGSCVAAFGEPEVADIASGTGLFVDLLLLPDGRLAAVYYDRNARELRIAVENSAGTSVFTETTLDGGGNLDRGMWASAVVDGAGVVHVAYQDALGDQVFYTTFNGTPGTPELVDDGQRPGDRPHNVGAACAIFLSNGAPSIAYQDGLTSDVYLASRGGGTWSTQGISISPLLDGFSIAATTGHGQPYLAWDRLDPSLDIPNGLFVQAR